MSVRKHFTALAALAVPAAAQVGDFRPGDLYFYNPAFYGPSSGDGAIVRVEPTTGVVTLLHDLATSSSGTDQMAYDPWRDRLIFFGGFVPNHSEVYLTDAAGNLTSLGFGTPGRRSASSRRAATGSSTSTGSTPRRRSPTSTPRTRCTR
jgi:hypothetical protein